MNITFKGSPNYTKGRGGQKVTGVIIHWMAGNLASTDAVFQNRSRNTSAHYGIEDTNVHQYVRDEDTAYHSGNWTVNTQTIGIEHSAQPGRDASGATMETSAQLIADLASKHGFNINSSTVRPHNAIKATQCPGTINVQWLINRANALTGRPHAPAPRPSIPSPAVSLETVTVGIPVLNVRSAPTSTAPLAGSRQLKKGDTFKIVGRVSGQMVNGISTWVKSQKGNYVWAGGLVGQTSPKAPDTSGVATVIVNTANVRDQPTTASPLSGSRQLHKGDTFAYNGVVSGQSVGGNNQWVRSTKGNYVHSSLVRR
jgi:hypothetical protein